MKAVSQAAKPLVVHTTLHLTITIQISFPVGWLILDW